MWSGLCKLTTYQLLTSKEFLPNSIYQLLTSKEFLPNSIRIELALINMAKQSKEKAAKMFRSLDQLLKSSREKEKFYKQRAAVGRGKIDTLFTALTVTYFSSVKEAHILVNLLDTITL